MSLYDSTTLYDAASLTFDGGKPGLANLPVVGVFIAFNDGPYVADPNWTEVTNYVRQVSIRRGRQDDLQQFPAGSASVELDNRARLFDPFNTAGTYNGKLKPRRQIKIVGQWAGVNYPLFRGFVAGWPVEYSEGGKDSTVTIDCFDALGLLATEKLELDLMTSYVKNLGPVNYWKFNESQPVTVVKDQQPFGWDLYPAAGVTNDLEPFEKPPLADGFTSSSLSFPSWESNNRTYTLGNPVFYFDWQIMGWLQLSTYSSGGITSGFVWELDGIYFEVRASGNNVVFTVGRLGTSFPSGIRYNNSRTIALPTGGIDTPFHFAVINRDGTPSLTPNIFVYINGVLQTQFVSTGLSNLAWTSSRKLRVDYCTLQEMSTFIGRPDQVTYYNRSIGRFEETTKARFERLLEGTSFPSSLAQYVGSPSASVSLINRTDTVLTEMQRTAESEGGELFVDASGVVKFVARNYWASETRSNTSQVDFTDTGTGVYYDAGAIRVDLNADQVRNEVNVSFSSGGVVSAVDEDSVQEFGAANEAVDTYLSSGDAQTLADYIVDIYSQPKIRVEPFLVKGQRNPSYNWPRLLALDLIDRFTFVRTPSVGSAISKPMLLQSIEHRFTPGTWETIINGSARYTGWFVLDSSLLDGEDVLL